jgi:hypothetical protein
MESTNKSYASIEFCGLCRGLFPLEIPEDLDVWQSKFRAGTLAKASSVVTY